MRYIVFSLVFIGLVLVVSCTSNREEVLPDCSASTLTLSLEHSTDAACNAPGAVTVKGTGGQGALSYSMDGTNYQDHGDFALTAGDYTLTVRDENLCTATLVISVEDSRSDLSLQADVVNLAGCEAADGSVSLSATGGMEPYAYQVDDSDFTASGDFHQLTSGTYTFSVMDVEGCQASVSLELASGISLNTHIMPIIAANCAISGCHLDTRVPILSGRNAVINNATQIASRTAHGTMPPTGTLPQAEIDLIACWVADGAKDN